MTNDTDPSAGDAPNTTDTTGSGDTGAGEKYDLREVLVALNTSVSELKNMLKSRTPPGRRDSSTTTSSCQGHATNGTVYQHCGEGRPADEIVAAMSQLNTLLLGSSPAFAQSMRLQTDAIASGLGALNAVSNQQSHYALELASTARGIVESHDRTTSTK